MLRFGRKVIGYAAVATAIFLLLNVALTVVLFASHGALPRLAADAKRLSAAGPRDRRDPVQAFNALYGETIGRDPDAPRMRNWLDRALSRAGPVVFDQTMADYALHRYGQIDARVLPPGVYVGARAIGPDERPVVVVSKHLVHYGFFVRHSFILVVPPPTPDGHPPAVALSAGLKKDFVTDRPLPDPYALHATVHPYAPGEYDFPNEGQAIHELFRLSSNPGRAASARSRLERAAHAIQASDMNYRLVSRNSNTVIGSVLRASGALSDGEEAALGRWPIALRTAGVSFDLKPAPSSPRGTIPAASKK